MRLGDFKPRWWMLGGLVSVSVLSISVAYGASLVAIATLLAAFGALGFAVKQYGDQAPVIYVSDFTIRAWADAQPLTLSWRLRNGGGRIATRGKLSIEWCVMDYVDPRTWLFEKDRSLPSKVIARSSSPFEMPFTLNPGEARVNEYTWRDDVVPELARLHIRIRCVVTYEDGGEEHDQRRVFAAGSAERQFVELDIPGAWPADSSSPHLR